MLGALHETLATECRGAAHLVTARRFVSHRHVRVNGRIVDRPSAEISPGDVVSLTPRALNVDPVIDALGNPPLARSQWIDFDADTKRARIARLPAVDEIRFRSKCSGWLRTIRTGYERVRENGRLG